MRHLLPLLVLACTSDKDVPVDTDTPPVDTVDETDTVVVDTDTGVEDTDDTPAPTGAILRQPGQLACTDPLARETALFEERDVEYPAALRLYLSGGGAAAGDVTGDGLVDILAVTHSQLILYTQSNAGRFDPTVLLTEPDVTEFKGLFGATVVDVDDDGDLDALVTARGLDNHLLINDGTGTFTDGTAAAGIEGPAGHHSTSSSWSDWDGDGDLDLLIAGHGWVDEEIAVSDFGPAEPTLMYENQGDGTFTDVSHLLADHLHAGYTFLGGWVDADDDGDDDLYMVNDFGVRQEPARLVWNDGGTFTADMDAQGIDVAIAGMGLALGDYDGDGLEEIAVPAWNINAMFQRRGGVWFDISQAMGFQPDLDRTVGWGSEFVDVDNDGELDITTAYGYLDTIFGGNNFESQPDAMYVQREGVLSEMSHLGAFDDRGPHRSMLPVDLDGDGWLDFVKIGLHGVGKVYLSNCGEDSWVSVALNQPAPNIHAVGATIRIFDGDRQWMRRIRAGGTGYGTGGPPVVHFGLGEVEMADRVVVEWPDGRQDTYEDVPMRQHLVVDRAE